MNRAERIYRIDSLLKERPRPLAELVAETLSSRATVVRDLTYLKDFMGAPIDYDRATNGYRYRTDAGRFELPGFWLNESELFGLLAAEQLLERIQPGLLAQYIGPLRARIRKLLAESGHSAATVAERVLLQPFAARPSHPERFGLIATALLEGRQLDLRYHGRERDRETSRRVHPQRLLHYRDNWYLLGWCERAGALRQFSLDRVLAVTALPEAAQGLPAADLDRFLGAAFGIFTGVANAWAVLRFAPRAARWVSDERWHPDQLGQWKDGHWELQVPYSDPRELVMDILRHGDEVEVLAPPALREMVAARLRAAAGVYDPGRLSDFPGAG